MCALTEVCNTDIRPTKRIGYASVISPGDNSQTLSHIHQQQHDGAHLEGPESVSRLDG